LLAEEIGFGLFLGKSSRECPRDHRRSAPRRRGRPFSIVRRILVDGEEHGDASARRGTRGSHGVPGGLGGNEPTEDVLRRDVFLKCRPKPCATVRCLPAFGDLGNVFRKRPPERARPHEHMITCPTPSFGTSWTVRPAASALLHEVLSLRSPTTTLTPLSFRLSAWACPGSRSDDGHFFALDWLRSISASVETLSCYSSKDGGADSAALSWTAARSQWVQIAPCRECRVAGAIPKLVDLVDVAVASTVNEVCE